ncbi:MAG: ribbon-helix-helix protein, CopG family [Paraclostridium sp.]
MNKKLDVRVSEEMKKKIEKLSIVRNEPISKIIREFLEKEFKKHKIK